VLDPAGQPVEGSSDRWPEVRRILSKAVGGEAATPLAEPPRILPTSDTNELWPLLKLLSTMVFAAKKHRRDVRKDPGGTPYIAHPLAVSRILTEVGIRDVSVLQVALLHDTLEDTDTTFAELQANFGVEVARAVESLTDDDSLRPATRKLAQLRGVSALPLKAKLVRIADKLHNVWDILRHGIPGWSERRVESYVAWACELVRALEGTHAALERRFHQEVSLPPSYEPGDWERRALQRVEDSQDFEELELMSSLPRAAPLESDGAEAEELPEHKACSSLLRAAEFMARRSSGGADQIIRRCSTALILAQRGVRDVETLQAALLQGIGFKRPEGSQEVPADCPELAMIRSRFGEEVAEVVSALQAAGVGGRFLLGPGELARLPHRARLAVIGDHLRGLRDLQVAGLDGLAAEHAFAQRLLAARRVRAELAGTHPELEAGLDEVFRGQVRVASGELVPVASRAPPPL